MKNVTTKIKSASFTRNEIELEADRLYENLSKLHWSYENCLRIASTTLEINYLKKERNFLILAHSYQTSDILFGVADFIGDSFYLSKIAQDVNTAGILFAGVKFMAETAKILNPSKIVLLPDKDANCSLSDSITSNDVLELKKNNPGVPVITYINTTADVKAESDIIVTSSNASQILRNLDVKKVIFLPDKYMAQNMQSKYPEMEFISWNGTCIVHEEFSQNMVHSYRKQFNDLQILVHTECGPEVVAEGDMAGGTGDMIRYIENQSQKGPIMLVTECGLVDRLRVEYPGQKFVGRCNFCPYMKRITLDNILETLHTPQAYNFIEIPEKTRKKALNAMHRMFDLTRINTQINHKSKLAN